MIHCARLASIHHEIMAMPMAYNSLVGDMGSSLSGGQKQRVMLARSLYREPRILFLDEGTSNLDVENEKRINNSLKNLKITRINVAHRPEISTGTDRILWIARTLVRDTRAASPPVITGQPHEVLCPANETREMEPGRGIRWKNCVRARQNRVPF
jgi:ATP-binding cassette subfamily B protein RaxB